MTVDYGFDWAQVIPFCFEGSLGTHVGIFTPYKNHSVEH